MNLASKSSFLAKTNPSDSFSDDNHMLIHRYGCSVARRQIQETPLKGDLIRSDDNKMNFNKHRPC